MNYSPKSQLRCYRRRHRTEYLPIDDPKEESSPSAGPGIVVDFEATHSQFHSKFLSLLPVEVRGKIYLELWRQAGLAQHILEYSTAGGVAWHRHSRCVTQFDAPRGEESWPESLPPLVAYQRWRLETTWSKTCFTCTGRFDHGWPSAPVEKKTAFMPMIVCCKTMHLEILDSIARNIRFVFEHCTHASRFLENRSFSITHQLRHVLITDDFELTSGPDKDWNELMKKTHDLPNLQTLYIWMEYIRRNWRNDKPRHVIQNPRLCVRFSLVPSHVNLKVSVPIDSLQPRHSSEETLGFAEFVDGTGGVMDGATMPLVLGDEGMNL